MPPAGCVGVEPRGSSSSASGFPRVSATILSRTVTSRVRVTVEPSRARASPAASPRTSSCGRCRSSSPGSRAANTNPTGSASRRRATKASVSAEVRSSHCASSTTHSSGRCSATSERRLSTARPTRKRSGASPGLRPKTIRSAVALRTGQPLEPIEERGAELMQARERQLHLGLDADRRARRSGPSADSTRCSSSADFPIPASPRSTNDRLSPRRTSSIRSSSCAHSSVRPRRLMCGKPPRCRSCADQGVDQGPHGGEGQGVRAGLPTSERTLVRPSRGDPHELAVHRRNRSRRRAEPPRGVRRHVHEPVRRHRRAAPARGRSEARGRRCCWSTAGRRPGTRGGC